MPKNIYKSRDGFVYQEFNQFVERLWAKAHDKKIKPSKRAKFMWDYNEAMSRYEDQESWLKKELEKEMEKSCEKFNIDKRSI